MIVCESVTNFELRAVLERENVMFYRMVIVFHVDKYYALSLCSSVSPLFVASSLSFGYEAINYTGIGLDHPAHMNISVTPVKTRASRQRRAADLAESAHLHLALVGLVANVSLYRCRQRNLPRSRALAGKGREQFTRLQRGAIRLVTSLHALTHCHRLSVQRAFFLGHVTCDMKYDWKGRIGNSAWDNRVRLYPLNLRRAAPHQSFHHKHFVCVWFGAILFSLRVNGWKEL
jgi:hypothetical protein